MESFARELENLTDSKSIAKNSRLVKLSPFIDESDGLLRVGDRIQDAPIAYDTRHPMIVNGKSEICRLIINEYHHQLSHGPTDYVLSFIKTRYWLVNGRSEIKKYANNCLYCKKQRVTPKPPCMGNLPARHPTLFCPRSRTPLLTSSVPSASNSDEVSKRGVGSLLLCQRWSHTLGSSRNT